VNPLSETFDEFVDDLISSDINLLKGELDFLIFQHIFQSIDLQNIEIVSINIEDESLAA